MDSRLHLGSQPSFKVRGLALQQHTQQAFLQACLLALDQHVELTRHRPVHLVLPFDLDAKSYECHVSQDRGTRR